MAFGSIERYFLIFHERFIHRWRHILHYPFICFCFIYPLTLYSMIVNYYPCKSVFYNDAYVCGGHCYQFEPIIGTVDYLTDVFSPAILVLVANLILLFRVIKQKQTMKIANTWRRNRLLYIQLLSISILYFLIWIPYVIVALIRMFPDPFFFQGVPMLLLSDALYICPLGSPFISLIDLPAVQQHLRQFFYRMIGINRTKNNRIGPTVSLITKGRRQQYTTRHIRHDETKF